jgi:hypothetical protein
VLGWPGTHTYTDTHGAAAATYPRCSSLRERWRRQSTDLWRGVRSLRLLLCVVVPAFVVPCVRRLSEKPVGRDTQTDRYTQMRTLSKGIHAYMYTHVHTHTQTHARTHKHTHTHTHTHTCTYVHTPRTLSWTQRPRRWVTGTWKRRPRVGCCLPTPCIVASAGSTYIAPCGVRKCMRTKKVSLRCRRLYDMLIRSLHS